MLTERMMEDAIAANPQKYLGEECLELLARQYRIGSYIFEAIGTEYKEVLRRFP